MVVQICESQTHITGCDETRQKFDTCLYDFYLTKVVLIIHESFVISFYNHDLL